jgi:hypothetical protein
MDSSRSFFGTEYRFCNLFGRSVMELRMNIDDKFMNTLQLKLGGEVRASDVVREALTILNWAVDERLKGRLILSADSDGKDVTRLALPSLEQIAGRLSADSPSTSARSA